MIILGTAIWAIVIIGIIVALRRMNKGPEIADEPLAQELAILRAEYPGRYCSVSIRSYRFDKRKDIVWRAHTSGIRYSGKGKTFREAMLNLKIEEGKR